VIVVELAVEGEIAVVVVSETGPGDGSVLIEVVGLIVDRAARGEISMPDGFSGELKPAGRRILRTVTYFSYP
jgi:hypothetical protein